jgi:MoaA/NifB/PqqE/SkfB family radical SAM enzyme
MMNDNDDILDFITSKQIIYGRHLAISITNKCALKCKHCISNSTMHELDMPDNILSGIAGELKYLNDKVKLITITGGEPFLRPESIYTISNAAHNTGIKTAVISSAYWAMLFQDAKNIIKKFGNIDIFCFSTDAYHLEYVPLSNVQNAYEAAQELGKTAKIQLSIQRNPSEHEQQLLEQIRHFAGDDLLTQEIYPVGRGADLSIEYPFSRKTPFTPCFSNGPFITYNGIALPCCCALVSTNKINKNNPITLGYLPVHSLSQIYERIPLHPIFQYIRLWGFYSLIEHLKTKQILNLPENHLDFSPCYTCLQLFSNPSAITALNSLKEETEFRLSVAAGLWNEMQDSRMLENLFKTQTFQNEVLRNYEQYGT